MRKSRFRNNAYKLIRRAKIEDFDDFRAAPKDEILNISKDVEQKLRALVLEPWGVRGGFLIPNRLGLPEGQYHLMFRRHEF